MPFKRIAQSPRLSLAVGGGTVTIVGAATSLILVLAGTPAIKADPAAQVEKEEQTAAATTWQETPATQTLQQALGTPPSGWSKDGELQRSVTAPYPYSCPQAGTAPAVALAQNYNASGHRIQIVTAAYTAGLGAEAMARQVQNVPTCSTGSGPSTVKALTGDVPGVEARSVDTSRGGVNATVVSSRRGDVITYVIGSQGAPVQSLAATFDDALERVLQGKCIMQNSTAQDAARSPWSTAGYKGLLKDEKVSIPAIGLPSIPEGSDVKKTELPAKLTEPRKITPAAVPRYAVWPEMPAVTPFPELPTAPSATPPTDVNVPVPVKDENGPGCGWAFTGMTPVRFDQKAADDARANATISAQGKLAADAKEWQRSVQQYWSDVAAYEKSVVSYSEYATAVETVNKAWAAIADDWAAYDQRVADRDAKIKARDEFLSRQRAAESKYADAVATCSAPKPSPAATPDDKPSTTPSPMNGDPAPTPPPTNAPSAPCTVDKPAILDQEAPAVPDAPKAPSDPRPKP